MATVAIIAEYAEDAADFARELEENGHEVSFGVLAPGERSYSPPGAYEEVCKAHVFPSEWRQDFSADVRKDDKLFFVGHDAEVASCTHMVDGSQRYKIEHVEPFDPAGVVIYFEVQVRA